MAVSMRVVTVGQQRVGRAFSIVSSRMENLAPAFRAIAQVIRQEFAKEILTQGRGTWEPLNAKYAQEKNIRWGPQPMLVASGGLFDSLTREGAPNNVTRIEDGRLIVGSTDPKLVFHQGGGARTIMPRRPPINITPQVQQRWMTIIEDHIDAAN